jgi:molecular chaperone DnaK
MTPDQLDDLRSKHIPEGLAHLSAVSLAEWMSLNEELGLPSERYAEDLVAPYLLPSAGPERNSLARRRYKLAQFIEWLGVQAEQGGVHGSVLVAWCPACATPGDSRSGRCPDCGTSFPPQARAADQEGPIESRRIVSRMIGIDLGTMNSRVAIMEDGVPRIVCNQEGASSTPSVVAFTASGERLVGSPASRQGLTNTDGTVSGVMRFLARKFTSREVAAARQSGSCFLTEGPDGEVHLGVEGKIYSATDVLSSLLADLKAAADAKLGESAEGAVISCPAHFYDAQRRAIKDAAITAGFKTASLINTTTAAALAYRAATNAKAGIFAVFHLGGGSFDASIVEFANGLCIVRSTSGDALLGGVDFDQRIVDWLCAQARREFGIAFQPDGMALMRLREAAERAKCELNATQKTNISLPFLSADRSGPKHLNTVLTRQKYETLTRDLIERLVELSRRCLADAALDPGQIDHVLLVGGQTRAPRIRQLVRRLFGREASSAIDPETAVSIGAAIQGSRLAWGEQEDTILDVASYTLGIEGDRGESIPLIERNSTIPTRKRQVLITSAVNHSRIQVHMLQGEADLAIKNESLGWREVTGIPAMPAGEGHVELDFGIDEDGIVYVESLAKLIHKGQRVAEGDLDRALADYDEAIRFSPYDASAYQGRGSARFDKGDYHGAIADYDEAIRLNPDDAATYEKRGYARAEKGDLDGALGDLRQALHLAEASLATRPAESVEDCKDLDLQANVAFFSGDYEGFLRWNLEASKRSPKSGWAEAGVASAYACKFAASGVAEYKAQTLFHLAKAKKLAKESDECAACLREYEERTLYRLETREIISSGEYGRRFPKGHKTRPLRVNTHP